MANLGECIEAGSLSATIELVIASREGIAGIEIARSRGLDVKIAAQADFESTDSRHDQITQWITAAGIDLVCLCGYTNWLRLDPPLQGRVINIHPALLPDFGGKGMYGSHVHRAALSAGKRFSGCTVHFVDEQYDHGPTILQRACSVRTDDDEHSLAARVFEQECLAYPEAIRLIALNRVVLEHDQVRILPETIPA